MMGVSQYSVTHGASSSLIALAGPKKVTMKIDNLPMLATCQLTVLVLRKTLDND